MKKIAWCVPLSFVTAVIFLLGNAAPAQAALVCEWGYISVGGNEYIRQLICYENGGEGREDIKYGTRPGSNNPRDGGAGGFGGGDNNAAPTLAQLVKNFCIKEGESQQDWADRVYGECKKLTPLESTTCRTIYTSVTIAIGQGGMNPPPIPCP